MRIYQLNVQFISLSGAILICPLETFEDRRQLEEMAKMRGATIRDMKITMPDGSEHPIAEFCRFMGLKGIGVGFNEFNVASPIVAAAPNVTLR